MRESARRQRVLVLGAGGFIGKQLVRALSASDWAIPVGASFHTVLRPADPVETVRLDARNAPDLKRALSGVSGVVNCITGDGNTIVASARALFESCSGLSPSPRVVHMSTMMVYGTATGLVDETMPLRGDWDEYSAAKTEAELLSRSYANVVNLRPGIVYGPSSPIWSGRIGQWLRMHRLGDLGAEGSGLCNLVHIDDVVRAILLALQLPNIEGHAFNLSLPLPPTWNEYFRLYSAALGTRCRPISGRRLKAELYVLAPALKVAEIVARTLHIARQPPAPIRPWFLRLCRHPISLDVGHAERVLGMKWMPLEDGLRQSAAWALTAT
jgi:2-alkyl-3-oxoalkanoate reductase